jgi:hypothetical protein
MSDLRRIVVETGYDHPARITMRSPPPCSGDPYGLSRAASPRSSSGVTLRPPPLGSGDGVHPRTLMRWAARHWSNWDTALYVEAK